MRHAAIVCAAVFVCAAMAQSQELVIRLIDGKTGKAMTDKSVPVHFCPDCLKEYEVRIGSDGRGLVKIRDGAETVSFMTGHKHGSEPNRIGYENCNGDSLTEISLEQVMQRGFASGSNCGNAKATARAGEVVFWAHPLPWRKPDFQ
jgi:hypothetical protein